MEYPTIKFRCGSCSSWRLIHEVFGLVPHCKKHGWKCNQMNFCDDFNPSKDAKRIAVMQWKIEHPNSLNVERKFATYLRQDASEGGLR